MILHPYIIALTSGALLTSCLFVFAACFACKILRRWDISSGSSLQIALERRTYLLTTIISCCLLFQLISLFLFIYTADSLCHLFPGAMCAAGTLNLNPFGYPTLVLKLINAFMAGIWLIVNHADNKGHDYPLIRFKYRLLLSLTPFVVAEAVMLVTYFTSLRPHVITSCCGSLFSSAAAGATPVLAAIPVNTVLVALGLALLLVMACGIYYRFAGRGGYLFALSVALVFVIGVAAVIVALPVYIYALPTHHCPFCMLHREYQYVGYLLYGTLLGGGVTGVGVGILQPFRQIESLASSVPVMQQRLAIWAMVLYGAFAMFGVWKVVTSELQLF